MAITYGNRVTIEEFGAMQDEDRTNYVDRLEVREARQLVKNFEEYKAATFQLAQHLGRVDTWLKKYLKGDFND